MVDTLFLFVFVIFVVILLLSFFAFLAGGLFRDSILSLFGMACKYDCEKCKGRKACQYYSCDKYKENKK